MMNPDVDVLLTVAAGYALLGDGRLDHVTLQFVGGKSIVVSGVDAQLLRDELLRLLPVAARLMPASEGASS